MAIQTATFLYLDLVALPLCIYLVFYTNLFKTNCMPRIAHKSFEFHEDKSMIEKRREYDMRNERKTKSIL
jgi:hypothetical protein